MEESVKVLIIGNGFGGVYTLKNLDKIFRKKTNVRISLIGEKNYFLFTPLLHEVATGSINPENIVESIRKVLGRCLDSFYLGKVDFVNLQDRTVTVNNTKVAYDYLVLSPGSETNFYNTPGGDKYSLTLKSLHDAIKIKNHLITQIESISCTTDIETIKRKLTFVLVGGGPTGVELAAEIHELIEQTFSHYYSHKVIANARVILIQNQSELIPRFGEKLRKKSLDILQKKGIEVILSTRVTEVGETFVTLDNGTKIETETTIWVAGIRPVEIKFNGDVEKNELGQVLINEYLQIPNYKEVFFIGDGAAFKNTDYDVLQALAQVAEKQAKHVALNIKYLITNKELKKFVYRHSGNLVSIGQWMALGEVFHIFLSGRITWWIWRTVYLSKLISFRKKVRVAFDWTINIFSPRDISQF
ncbi:MAG: NAD(P)/FAD-dependent oxidoreductase [Patescibacteria group bacterium]